MESNRRQSPPSVFFTQFRSFTLVCLLLLSGAASALEVATAFPAAAPETTGLSAGSLEQLAAKVEGYLEQEQLVGAELLVIKNRKTVLHRTFGHRDREDEIAMTVNTIFNIRSMTKPLTGAAIQLLIDDGRLSPDDRAAEFLPAFDNEDSGAITVEQLLTHRSGLPLTVLASINQYENLQALAAAAGKRGPQFPPGSKFWYSDAGTDVLGAIVEKVSGETLDVFWERRLLEPLGMTDSFVALDKSDPRWGRLASIYIGTPGNWFRFWAPTGDPLYPFAWGSQTMYATPMDYARFLALWMDDGQVGDRRVLSSAAVERTLTPVSIAKSMASDARAPTGFSDLETYYGQMALLWMDADAGEGASPRVVGHSGSDGTFAWAWPAEDLMVLYFTQSRGGISGLSLERWIDELLLHPGRQPVLQTSTDLYEEVVGEYLADFGSLRNTTLEVLLLNGRPAVDLGRGRVIELRDPDERRRWAFAISGKTAVSFSRNQDGVIDALRMHEGSWSFEAPRKGVPTVGEIAADQLRKYLGTYRVEEMDANVEVIVHDQRLTVDLSELPVSRPVDLFQLRPPNEEGRWIYRVNENLSVSFDEDDEGVVTAIRLFENRSLDAIAKRVTKDDVSEPPSVEENLVGEELPNELFELEDSG